MYRRCLKLSIFFSAFLLFLFLPPNLSWASMHLKGWTHFGIRPLGMGNAFVAVADDYNALFYNPAGLALQKDFKLQFLSPSLSASSSAISLARDIKDAMDDNKEGKNDNSNFYSQYIKDLGEEADNSAKAASGVLKFALEHEGEDILVNVSLTPYIMFLNFGMAVGADGGVQIDLKKAATVRDIITSQSLDTSESKLSEEDLNTKMLPIMDIFAGYRVFVPVGYGEEFLGGKLKVGAALKFFTQQIYTANIDSVEAYDNLEGKKDFEPHKDSGVAADVGVLISQPNSMFKPTLGITLSNIGAPQYLDTSLSTGVSLQLYKSDLLSLLVASDIQSINYNTTFSNKFGMGVELGIWSFLKLQAGVYHNALTAGVNVDLFLFDIRAATYASEKAKSRVYTVELKILI